MSGKVILDITDLQKSFGGIRALDGISLQAFEGEILGLIGPNGAGKTALLNTITGFYRPTAGSIRFQGHEISTLPLYEIGRCGVGRTFQNIRLFKRMTVLENVMVADKRHATSPLRSLWNFAGRAKARAEAMALLDMMQLTDKADDLAASLSYGDSRRLEIARALAGKPALMLLDEPAAGMKDAETEQLVEDIHRIRSRVGAMVLIEHDMSLIRSLSDRAVAMDYGRKIAEGDVHAVLEHPEVRRAYLGDDE
ncbi:MAG: ABC transporter ATP-binding protein [Alcaligenaceae bacterium]|nr:ABC transporter ATP-binding protein [Alcaligenaceae bacterium]